MSQSGKPLLNRFNELRERVERESEEARAAEARDRQDRARAEALRYREDADSEAESNALRAQSSPHSMATGGSKPPLTPPDSLLSHTTTRTDHDENGEKQAQIESLTVSLNNATANAEKLQDQICVLREECRSLKSQKNELEINLAGSTQRDGDKQQRIEHLEALIRARQQTIDELESERNTMQDQEANLKRALGMAEKDLCEERARAEAAKAATEENSLPKSRDAQYSYHNVPKLEREPRAEHEPSFEGLCGVTDSHGCVDHPGLREPSGSARHGREGLQKVRRKSKPHESIVRVRQGGWEDFGAVQFIIGSSSSLKCSQRR
ncbi:hypothetical protein FH972_024924 [Carpinus fangiana]|uniref:Uncharacterized protein n=1 Tax=Carpinus fangiana TaxID=176857 RepID=A0A5N6L036_9ROSI|nr:hypothetical protein FH972_024924 [Carpinus fangiana]